MPPKHQIQYVYAPASGNAKDAEVYIGKPKQNNLFNTVNKAEDEKDDTPKIKTVGIERSNKIKSSRASFNFNQEEFAKHIGVSKQVITLYENANSIFNPSEWDKIMRGIDQINKMKRDGKLAHKN